MLSSLTPQRQTTKQCSNIFCILHCTFLTIPIILICQFADDLISSSLRRTMSTVCNVLTHKITHIKQKITLNVKTFLVTIFFLVYELW